MQKIVAIDDKHDNLIAIRALVKNFLPDTVVFSAQSGQRGLDIVKTELPDVILLDLVMPGMDGYEVCTRLKAELSTQHIPIIMLTAIKTDSQSRVKALESGADAFLSKPIEEAELVAQINAMLRIKRAEDELRREKDVLEELVQERTKVLQNELNERKLVEKALLKRTHDLGERVKELNCLYGISHLTEKPGMTLPEILQGTVELIPAAWQYPEITCARIIFDRQEFKTGNFRETFRIQNTDISVHGKRSGSLEVGYLGERAEEDEGPFLEEERNLLNGIAQRLGGIIERIQTQEALRESEERMKLALEGTDQGLWDWDIVHGDITFDENWPKVLGYTPGEREFDFNWWNENVHPDTKPAFEKAFNAYLEGREKYYELEYQLRVKSGEWRWIWARGICVAYDEQGQPLRMIGTHRDITGCKRAEVALQKSEQQYRLLVKNVADGIGIVQDGRLAFVNESLASILGFSAEHLLGRSPVDLFQHDDNTQFEEIHTQLEHGKAEFHTWPILQRIMRADKREAWIEGRQSAITWQGQPAIMMNMRDITERKLREMALAEERNGLRQENLQLRASIKERYRLGEIVGKSQPIQEVYEMILKVSDSEKDVLIGGESGTGKELIARSIHQRSARQAQDFVPVNCGAIPESLFEREFFGHRKGAFTGADRDKQGFFDSAHQGTLFLDEVGELSPAMQVKLLRAIENGEYTPVGDNRSRKVNVRIIAASNRDLAEQVEKNVMREDFFYRIHVILIDVPPLRERREDIPLLVDHFVQQYGDGASFPAIPEKILETLYNYDWPGNIRQLRNVLYRYLTLGSLDFSAPRSSVPNNKNQRTHAEFEPDGPGLHEMAENFEKQMISCMLEQYRWHRGNTATRLRIDPKTLYRKMKQYRLL